MKEEKKLRILHLGDPGKKFLLSFAFTSFVLFSLALLLGCDSGGEVLASYEKEQKVHTVKREELRWILKMQNQNPNTQKPSTALQQQVLKSYLFSQIISQENSPEIQKSEFYRKQSLFLEEKAKLAAYELHLREKDESFRFEFLEAQLVSLAQEKSPDKTKKSSLSKQEQDLLRELNSPKMSDAEIEEKVYQISQHPRYRLQGGYLEPICISCASNPFSDIMKEIKKAKPATFIAIQRSGAVWFLRVIKRYMVEEEDVQDRLESFYRKRARVARKYIVKLGAANPQKAQLQDWFDQDKMERMAEEQSKWLVQKEKSSFASSKINTLRKKRKYKVHEAGNLALAFTSQSKNKKKVAYKADTLLYSLEAKDYTYGDLQKDIGKLGKGLQTKELKDPIRQLRIMHSLLLPLRLLEKEKDFQKMAQGPLYKFVYHFIKNRLLTLSYYEEEKKKIKVPQGEILKHYQANKNSLYKGKTRGEALKLARKETKKTLFQQWQKKKQEELSRKYKLTIKNKLLKADKV